jgi:hypothetical protein
VKSFSILPGFETFQSRPQKEKNSPPRRSRRAQRGYAATKTKTEKNDSRKAAKHVLSEVEWVAKKNIPNLAFLASLRRRSGHAWRENNLVALTFVSFVCFLV